MSVSSARRFALPLVVLTVSFVIFKCGTYRSLRHPETFCTVGNNSPSKPMICVDDQNLSANPHHAWMYDVESKNHQPTNRPVVVQWFSQHTADLQIQMITPNCTEPVQCDGRGHCWTTVKKLTDSYPKVCHYSITLGDTKYDPEDDIVINPCCM
jgi:hypothetical protein